MRSLFLWLTFIGLAFAAERPNVLVLLADDLGVMDTNLRDRSFYRTPNIQRLAARGMVFENGYCAHPRCVPSRFAIQTGRFPCRDTMNAGPPEVPMRKRLLLAEAFKAGGYDTFFAGKWHLGKEQADWPQHCGYDTNIGGCHAGAPGSYLFPWHVVRKTGKAGKYGPMHNLAEGEADEHITDRLSRETASWIRAQAKTDAPFFAFLSFYAVHTPLEGKPGLVRKYKTSAEELTPVKSAFLKRDGTTKMRRDHPTYAAMIETMDTGIGSLLDLLDELKLAENTILLFTSDHGGLSNRGPDSKRELATSNEPYRAGKGHMYEGGLRVPFVVAYPPRVKAGTSSESVALGTDIYPTLLDLCGLELQPRDHMDGISLVPALSGTKQVRDKPVIWHSPLPRPDQTGDAAMSVIRVGNKKLIKRYFPESLELYDLAVDPLETNNLVEQRTKEAEAMKTRLENHLLRFEAMPPRKHWKDKSVTATLAP